MQIIAICPSVYLCSLSLYVVYIKKTASLNFAKCSVLVTCGETYLPGVSRYWSLSWYTMAANCASGAKSHGLTDCLVVDK